MKLYMVRHGESMANREGRHQGVKYDTNLSELGFEQARLVAKRLSGFEFDCIYTSGLKRAQQTANEINKYHGLKIIKDIRLNEIDRGNFAGMLNEDADKLWAKLPGIPDYTKRAPNGENVLDMLDRVRPFVNELMEKEFGNNVLIVSHAGTMRGIINILFPNICHYSQYRDTFPMKNTCLYEIGFDRNRGPEILLTNCYKHLEEIEMGVA